MRLRDGLAATSILAAAALPSLAAAQPVTGVYIGAGAGGTLQHNERTRVPSLLNLGRSSFGQTKYDVGGVGVLSAGYGLGNGIRFEVEGGVRYNPVRQLGGTLVPTAATGDRYAYTGMANAFFDLDVGSPYVYPYLGVGAGIAAIQFDRLRVTSPSVPLLFRVNDTDYSFAYQGVLGASFPVPPVIGLSLTAEYRFLGTVGNRFYNAPVSLSGINATFRSRQEEAYNHSLLLGLRYAFNVVPPPPPPAPAVQAPAPVSAARTYLVFFDWDRADLTARARQIIAEAASASQRTQTTRIEVSGHADRSGTPQYNQALSLRRANNVAAELVRLGVPRGAIQIEGFGESRPLVPTADGVREPQNRRVEIVLR